MDRAGILLRWKCRAKEVPRKGLCWDCCPVQGLCPHLALEAAALLLFPAFPFLFSLQHLKTGFVSAEQKSNPHSCPDCCFLHPKAAPSWKSCSFQEHSVQGRWISPLGRSGATAAEFGCSAPPDPACGGGKRREKGRKTSLPWILCWILG